jgi:hypothetical protein
MKDGVVFLPVKIIFKYVQKRNKSRASTEMVGWNERQFAVRQSLHVIQNETHMKFKTTCPLLNLCCLKCTLLNNCMTASHKISL